jgi:CBS domain containing-hemolysin-like protein
VLPLVKATNLAASRLIWPSFTPEPEIDLADIERAIELGTDDAVLLKRERVALRGLVEIAETRVAELMRPRSKLSLHRKKAVRAAVADAAPPGGYLMVTDSDGTITSAIGVRMLRPSQMDDLSEVTEPVIFVPWSALVSQVLDQLVEEDRSVAVVVNEFGEPIGALSIDDILRRVLAPRAGDDESPGDTAIEKLGEDHYRVLGSLSFRHLTKQLQIDPPEDAVTTVAGFIQRQNSRLPRLGDSAPLGRFNLIVVEEGKNAVWIEVRLNSPAGEAAR